ncbi:MAG: hypothetical protein JO359_07720, partial [Candidatus Eremiobacteraeota bacterium]|nr:hypothetical protein [Candidatus Eremiobacteraeota bacterium]
LGIADTIVIGVLGTVALAAISAATSVFIVLAIGLWAFPNAARIMGAQALGAGDPRRFGRIVRSSIIAPLAVAAAAAFVSTFAAAPLMGALLGGIPARDAAAHYLILRSISLIPIAISNHAIAAFSAAGDARLAPRTLAIINVIHIPLLVVLALGVGTHVPLGLFGAGLSSLISECVGSFYCLWAVARRPAYHILEPGIDPAIARTATTIALPDFVTLCLLLIPDAITVAFIAPLGAVAVAAFRAFTLVTDATWAVPGAFGDAIQIVVGQRIGAGDLAGARSFIASANRLAVVVGSVVAVVFIALAWPLTALVTLSPMLASVAALPLALHLTTLPIKSLGVAMIAPIRAAGDTRFAMWNGVLGAAVAIAAIAFCTQTLHLGLYAIGIAWIVSWTLRTLLSWLKLRTGDWERRRLTA